MKTPERTTAEVFPRYLGGEVWNKVRISGWRKDRGRKLQPRPRNNVMITSEDLERIRPKAVEWVTRMERTCAEIGKPLLPLNMEDAQIIGIQDLDSIRVIVLSEMPVPDDSELRRYFEQIKLAPLGMTFGHGIAVKDGHFARHLMAHELVHGLQYERLGGIGPFLAAYLPEVFLPPYYGHGPLELEAKMLADALCF
jgi:hypothetical protein